MALIGISAPKSQARQDSLMDKILKGVQITQGIADLGLGAYRTINEAEQAAQRQKNIQTEMDLNVNKATVAASPAEGPVGPEGKPVYEAGTFEISGYGPRVLRPTEDNDNLWQKLRNDYYENKTRVISDDEAAALGKSSGLDPSLFKGKQAGDPIVGRLVSAAQSRERIEDTKTKTGTTLSETDRKIRQNFVDKYNGDAVVKKVALIKDAAQNVMAIRDIADLQKNPIASAALPTFIARASGEVGNLSEADKRPFGGGQGLEDRLARFTEKQKSGLILDKDLEFIKQLAETMARSAQDRMNARGAVLAKQFAKTTPKYNETEVRDILGIVGDVDADVESLLDTTFEVK